MTKVTGGPAFPIVSEAHQYVVETGMTMRDYFAAKWLQGAMANPAINEMEHESMAECAYMAADAMLRERLQ